MVLAVILVACFLALNMGVSGFSVSFAPSYGSRLLTRSKAAFLYGLCVFAGAIVVGPRVVETLAHKISLKDIEPVSGFLILFSAAATMYLSNLLRIPQSTSFVTVASFLGAGLYYGRVNWEIILKIVITAVIFSALSFILTFLIKRQVYPPYPKNLRFYEKFHIHKSKFKRFIIYHDMYSAFGVGTNNVANAVAPLVSSMALNPFLALALAAPFFGLGAGIFGKKVINTVSKEIVPIGEISAAIISFISATFVLTASLLGLPTPYVQFTTFSVLAISCIKDGARHTCGKAIFKRIIWVWLLVPLAAVFLSLGLHCLWGGRIALFD